MVNSSSSNFDPSEIDLEIALINIIDTTHWCQESIKVVCFSANALE